LQLKLQKSYYSVFWYNIPCEFRRIGEVLLQSKLSIYYLKLFVLERNWYKL